MLKPNRDFARRYKVKEFDLDNIIKVETYSIDNIINDVLGEKCYGDVIKVDAQGADLEILKGAILTLTNRTCCVITEVCFCELYDSQLLFYEIDGFMRESRFEFFGFRSESYRSAELRECLKLPHRNKSWYERLIHADAIYFKNLKQTTLRQKCCMFAAAIVLGYYDFAVEILKDSSLPVQTSKTIEKEIAHHVATR